jgi:two-component system phosphate regulon sensor histidine kinase PhoR
MLYVAVPFHRDGSIAGVVRLSMPLTEVDRAISGWRRLVGGATILALLAAAAMSSLAAHLVSRSTRALTETALRMAAGDLDARTRATGSDEIGDLGRALDTMASTLATTLGDVKAERDLLGRIMDSMKEGVLLVGADGRIRLANPALREMLLLPSDIAGRLPIEVVRNAQLQRLLEESTGAGAASSEIELGDLKPRRLLVHAARLAGEPGGRLLVFVDVTDIRRLESLRRDFVANVSHELRTPVAAVRSAAETVRAAMRRRPEEAEEFIDIIERHADRLHRLVEDLLDLAKIESRELRLRLEPVDVRQVAEQVVALFRERASSRGIRLEVDTTREVAPARADRRALDQVVSNLVDNAVKYCHEGARVTVRASSTGAAVRLAVEDTGPGIAAVHLPRLFERFYRVDAGRSRDLGGTGLGLAIVKHLVEAMGGRTTVDSVPGKGSTFAFTLPAA